MRSLFTSFLLIAILSCLALPTQAGQIIESMPTDANVVPGAVGDGQVVHLYTLQAGTNFGGNTNIVEAFPLPYLAPGQTVTAATISMYLKQQIPAPATNPNYNLSLYGLSRVNIADPSALPTDYYIGTTDPLNTNITTSFVTPTTPLNSVVTYSGANLVSFVNKQISNVLFTGQDLSSTRYIFFRLNANADVENNGVCNYMFGAARSPTRTDHPTLTLTISGGISAVAGRLQFSFNLPQSANTPSFITSAGVYNPTTGALVRTLWNNVQYQTGLNYGYWDGNDDNGKPLAQGSPYQIKLIYHNVQYVWDGLVGNTSASQSGPNVYRAFGKIHDLAIAGKQAYYALGYNELECPFNTFSLSAPQVPSVFNFGYNLADGYSNFYYVAADSTRTYWAKVFGGIAPPAIKDGGTAQNGQTIGGVDTFVIAINNADNSFYTFPSGKALTKAFYQIYPSCCDYDSTPYQANPATGLAVQQTGNCLFVSHRNLNVVRVIDKVKGTLLGSITVAQPGRLACTANGDVWVVSNGATPSVFRYTFDTSKATATLDQTLTGFSNPSGVGVSADDATVLVTDGGASQQIKAFNNATGASTWTYGTLGGNPAGDATISSSSFDFNTQEANIDLISNEAFVTFQPDNTFWVEDGGNGRVLHFSMSGNALVYIEQISYVDASYRSTVDLTDPTRVFNSFMEYKVDYSKPLGGTNGSWTMVKNWSAGLAKDATHDYIGFANGLVSVVTMSNGRTYGFIHNILNNNWDLFELPATGSARFTGLSYPLAKYPLMYEDSTLRYNVVTATGITYYSQPLTGFDANNNPVWGSPATLASMQLNTAVDPIPWNAFPERTEVTAGGKVVLFSGYQGNTGYHLAGIPLGSSKFAWEASKTVNTPYWFPQDGQFDVGNGVQYAGNYALALGRNIVYGYHGELWKGGEASQWVNFLDNGLMVGRFGTYADSIIGSVSTNGYSGNSFSPALVHGPNGSVYLYHNDENDHGGSIRWAIKGWDGIAEMNGLGTFGSATNLNTNTAGPTVSISSPTSGAVFNNGSNINLSAQTSGNGAGIASVQFMDGSTILGTDSTTPYTMLTSALAPGSHVITAVATDSNGVSSTSPPVTIIVGADGTSAPPPAPTSLSSTGITAQSVSLSWTEPSIGTTSSTIGSMLSFQFDQAGDSFALKPTDVAGAAPYAAANWNLLGTNGTQGIQYVNQVNSVGSTVTNLGENLAMGGSDSTHSTQSLTGNAAKVFSTEVSTAYGAAVCLTFANIPYAAYDVVVYSLPSNISDANQTTTVTVNNITTSSVITQFFNKLPTTYSSASVAFGSNASVTNANTLVVQGLAGPQVTIQGTNIAGLQIVERPFDQGTPTSYTILRAGSDGKFASIGTASGSATTFTDTTPMTASTTYQYVIQAVNGFGNSANSNAVTVTTPAATGTASTNFSSWQSQYFTADQLADSTISGATADPYGSGVPNLLAYALQVNPATARPTDVPSPVITNGHLTVTYFVPNSITDITYIVEVSSDLVNWNSGSGYTSILTSVSSATGTTITVQDQLPATTQKHFMRLRVTQNSQ